MKVQTSKTKQSSESALCYQFKQSNGWNSFAFLLDYTLVYAFSLLQAKEHIVHLGKDRRGCYRTYMSHDGNGH